MTESCSKLLAREEPDDEARGELDGGNGPLFGGVDNGTSGTRNTFGLAGGGVRRDGVGGFCMNLGPVGAPAGGVLPALDPPANGSTLSPGLYTDRMLFFSSGVRSFEGLFLTKSSTRFCSRPPALASLTTARHAGQVNFEPAFALFGVDSELFNEANHDFAHAPQFAWRQSRKVTGSKRMSVQICSTRKQSLRARLVRRGVNH